MGIILKICFLKDTVRKRNKPQITHKHISDLDKHISDFKNCV